MYYVLVSIFMFYVLPLSAKMIPKCLAHNVRIAFYKVGPEPIVINGGTWGAPINGLK